MYSEDCCWNFIQERCIGAKCNCECHMPRSHLVTPQQLLLEAKRELERIENNRTPDETTESLLRITGNILRALLIERRI